MSLISAPNGYTVRLDANASGFAYSGMQRFPEQGNNAIYTIFRLPDSNAAVALNNYTGMIDYSGDATVNCRNVFQSVAENIQNISGVGTTYGAAVDVKHGTYRWTSGLVVDISGTTPIRRHGIEFRGQGEGTTIEIYQSGLADGISVRMEHFGLKDMRIVGGSGVTNLMRIKGSQEVANSMQGGGRGTIENVSFDSVANMSGWWVPISGQTAIYMDGVSASFFWQIRGCHFSVLDTGIRCSGQNSTSTFQTDNTYIYVNTAVDIGSNQHIIKGIWHQGNTYTSHTTVRVRGGANTNYIEDIHSELQFIDPPTNSQSIQLDSGAANTTIRNVCNIYASGVSPTSGIYCTVRDQSTNQTNYYEITADQHHYAYKMKHIAPELRDPTIWINTFGGMEIYNSGAGFTYIEFGNKSISGGITFIDIATISGEDYGARFLRNIGDSGSFQIYQNGTAPFQVVRSNTGNIASFPNAPGDVVINVSGQLTSGASAGGRGAVPATTAGFAIVNLSGNAVKMPYYLL